MRNSGLCVRTWRPRGWRGVLALALASVGFRAGLVARADGTPGRLEPYELRCDSAEDPLGIDSSPPRLSWKLRSEVRGQRQTAWQVLAASTIDRLDGNEGDLWDSGYRSGEDQLYVSYEGRQLRSSEQVFWKVRVWDREGRASGWSAPATWTMGILSGEDWGAQWITDQELLRWVRPKVGYRSADTTDAAETKWIVIDLGEPRLITSVRLYPIRQTIEEAQGFPLRFRVEAADTADFNGPKIIADHAEKPFVYASTRDKTTVPTFPAAEGGVTGRYVRVVTQQLRRDGAVCYLALSQIEVLAGGRNVAAGAQVLAKDSVEADQWSAASVTDGLEIRGGNPRDNGTLLVRRDFPVKPALRRALVHVSGLGHYELTVNGQRVGQDLLSPGWTAYHKTVLYDTHDITALLRAGSANALGLTLAGGMYNVRAERYAKFETLFRPLAAICQIRLEYADGTVDHIGTDETWKVSPGPITFSNMFGGEDLDARRVPAGWDTPGFVEAAWSRAVVHEGPGGVLRGASHAAPPIRSHETLTPLRVNELAPGVHVYDLGQNVSLMPRLRVRGPAGSSLKIIPAELLNADGSVDRRSCSRGSGEAWWSYTLAGRPEGEAWYPKFFYHGARYLQIELSAGEGETLPVVESLEGVVVHTASAPVGDFACSNELFNRVRTLIRWAQRSNLVSVITDCPHREKLGWLEQYHLNGPSLRYEFDLTRLYAKTFGDMADAQLASGLVPDIAPEYVIFPDAFRDSPEWGSAIILAAWQHYEWTGDDTPLRRYYPSMVRYVNYLQGMAEGHILSHGLGDWYDLGPKGPGRSQLTPVALTATATYYEDLKTLAAIATRLGEANDARQFEAGAAAVRVAFNQRFYDHERGLYATGSQCANAMPLVFGLVDPAERPRVLEALVRDVGRRGLTAGDVGYRYLLRALGDAGRSDVIFAMNNQSQKPGYGYQLAQGATSLTEAWNAGRGSSQNHFMLGQIMEWFYRDLAGISGHGAAPGFKQVVIRPQLVSGIEWARATYESPRGRIVSSWRHERGRLRLELEIPPGATAEVHLPTTEPDDITESKVRVERSAGVRRLRVEPDGTAVFSVESGRYVFSSPIRIPEPTAVSPLSQ
jgi:alpha-L-rhamnosidase